MGFLNKKIKNSNEDFFALDISDLSLKVFQREKKGKSDRIRSFSTVELNPACLEEGVIIDKNVFSASIKEAIKKAGPRKISTKKVVCSLPESKAFLRTISIPKMDEGEIGEAIRWEIEANIPLTVDQVYFDWQIMTENKDKLEVLTVAVAKEVIDNLIETLELAELEVYGLEVESIANLRSLIERDCSEESNSLIIDLGAKSTNIVIAEGNIPYFTSSIPFSSDGVTDIISKSLNVAFDKAIEMKADQGIEHSFDQSSIFNAVKPALENLTMEIERSLEFYKTITKNSLPVQKIILCGGGANLKGLVSYLTTRTSREVVVGDPWVNFDFGNYLPIINKEDAARYTTAIGLSLKDINYGYKA